MEHLDWNRVLDRYLEKGVMAVEDYEGCDDLQKNVLNEIKKAYKRINKVEVEKIHHSLKQNG